MLRACCHIPRLVSPPGDSVAQEPTTVLAVHRDHLRAMTQECYEVTSILVHMMIDRVRGFTSSDLHDEKMVSLGKLSAGLAHELNNPASAIERGAALLDDRLEESDRAARALGESKLTDAQLAAVAARSRVLRWPRARRACGRPSSRLNTRRLSLTGSADHGVDVATAEALADTAVTFEALDGVAGAVEGPALNAVLRWAAAGCSLRSVAAEIQDAATRIALLVAAIKGFTHMDQAMVAEPVDLAQGLSNTVAVLKSKARAKSAAVVVDVEPGLPLRPRLRRRTQPGLGESD